MRVAVTNRVTNWYTCTQFAQSWGYQRHTILIPRCACWHEIRSHELSHKSSHELGHELTSVHVLHSRQEGVNATEASYRALLAACQRGAHLEYALSVFESMERAGFRAPLSAYNDVMAACAKSRDCALAVQVCICIYVYIHIYLYICLHSYLCVYMYTYDCAYAVQVYVYIYAYIPRIFCQPTMLSWRRVSDPRTIPWRSRCVRVNANTFIFRCVHVYTYVHLEYVPSVRVRHIPWLGSVGVCVCIYMCKYM